MKSLIISVVLFQMAQPALAWRETGHFTVCEIAYRQLDLRAKQAVREILTDASFSESCTWPDQVRKSAAWKHSFPWHFVDLGEGETYPEAIGKGGDVVQALILNEDLLRDRSSSLIEKAAALKFLGHFVGDIHQPFHAGRKSDKGGNEVKLRWFGAADYLYEEILESETVSKREAITLHKVWDLHLLERFILEARLEDGTRYKHRAYADALERGGSGQAEGGTYLDWAAESRVRRDFAYEPASGDLGQAYYERHVKVVNERLLQAGRRLGALLNRIFSGAPLADPELEMRRKIKSALGAAGKARS